MVSVKDSFTDRSPPPQVLNYHALASRYLQKQFMHACVCIFLCCYVCSYIYGEKHNISNVFPWSRTSVRSGVLFAAIFPVALARKANLRVVSLVGSNTVATVLRRVCDRGTMRVFLAYLFGAFIITSVYAQNCDRKKAFSVLVTMNSYELPRLNERFLYLRFYSIYLAVSASIHHVLQELDLLEVPLPYSSGPLLEQIQSVSMSAVGSSALFASGVSLSAPLVYLLFRQPIFGMSLRVLRLLYPLPHANIASIWPVDFSMLLSTFCLGLTGSLLWFLLNVFFSLYLSQAPLRKGRLLSEKSFQPNATLLTGLVDKTRPLTQSLALKELLIVSDGDQYRGRRISLFEAGSPEAVQWKSTVAICLEIIEIGLQPLQMMLYGTGGSTTQLKQHGKQTTAAPRQQNTQSSPIRVVQASIFKPIKTHNHSLETLKSKPQSMDENQKQIAKALSASEHLGARIQSQIHSRLLQIYQGLPLSSQSVLKQSSAGVFRFSRLQLTANLCLRNLLTRSIQEDTYGRIYKDVEQILSKQIELHGLLTAVLKKEPDWESSCSQGITLLQTLETTILDIGLAFSEYVDYSSSTSAFIKSKKSSKA